MVEHIVQPVHATEYLQGAQLVHGKLQVCICINHQLVPRSELAGMAAEIQLLTTVRPNTGGSPGRWVRNAGSVPGETAPQPRPLQHPSRAIRW